MYSSQFLCLFVCYDFFVVDEVIQHYKKRELVLCVHVQHCISAVALQFIIEGLTRLNEYCY